MKSLQMNPVFKIGHTKKKAAVGGSLHAAAGIVVFLVDGRWPLDIFFKIIPENPLAHQHIKGGEAGEQVVQRMLQEDGIHLLL